MPRREATEAKLETARPGARRRAFPLVALVFVAVIALVVIARWRNPGDTKTVYGAEEALGGAAAAKAFAPFKNWDKPDFVIVLSGEQHGYLLPCGCSHPQLGGLVRRYNLIKMLEKRGWDVLSVDLGDIAQKSGLQAMLKYTTSMKALSLMGVAAVGLGANEMGMPLLNALGEYALNNPSPRVVAANLVGIEKDGNFQGMALPWEIASTKNRQKVGIIGLVGPSVKNNVKDPDAGFKEGPAVLPQVLKDIKAKGTDFLVLLYQGSEKEARNCADKLRNNFNLILHLSSDSEPPAMPVEVGNTSLITMGHKGRYVGVVGVYRTGKKDKPYTLKYHLMALGEEFETPKGREKNHPIMKLMEDYALEVKTKRNSQGDSYLTQEAKRQTAHPVQLAFPNSTYLGSKACESCHKAEYDKWLKSPHSHAYTKLTQAKNPALRQYDPECARCHVTGWGYKTGFTDEVKSKLLLNNGCENCHGPASEHVAMEKGPGAANKKERTKIRDLMNPYRFDPQEKPAARKQRLNLLDQSCQKCHDIDNDVNWKRKKWNDIVHSGDKIGDDE